MVYSISRYFSYFLFGLLIFTLLRFGYGHWNTPNGTLIQHAVHYSDINSGFELSRRNIAGQKKGGKSVGSVGPASVDQRYEKIAALGLVTDTFSNDEIKIRSIAKTSEALVQHEQAFGLTGRRQLQLALGVSPTKFDAVIAELRNIGRPISFQVNKTDKTNEYRQLLAKQQGLQKSRDNLVSLKSRDANLRDLIALETQILDLENQIQALGVSVGEFDSEFEFVTIKVAMKEVRAATVRNISFVQRAYVAFTWAIKYYLLFCTAFLVFAVGAYVLSLARATWSRYNQST